MSDQTLSVISDKREINKDYDGSTNDLAILHFTGGLPNGHKPVKIAQNSLGLQDGSKIILAGYGVTDKDGNGGEGTLRKTIVPILQLDYSSTQLTTNQRLGTGACFGDSGGPALAQTPSGLQLVGVTHGGPACDDYGIYTRPYSHLTWIAEASKRLHGLAPQAEPSAAPAPEASTSPAPEPSASPAPEPSAFPAQ
jgi:hypothetical protein